MRSTIRTIGLFGGIALLIYGLIPRATRPELTPLVSESRWLVLLWGSAFLLGMAAWASLPQLQTMGTRVNVRPGVLNLSLVFSILFVVLTIQLLRSEFIYAASIYNRNSTNPDTGVVFSNSRPVIQSLRVRRGAIYDRNNVLLAGSEVAPNGLARRTYPVAQQADVRAFSNILGYSSPNYGQSGLEDRWNGYLTGEQGQALRSLTDDLYNRPHTGNNLQLTLSAELQSRVWDILSRNAQGRPASAIVMDPKSGAVLAMVSAPGFDPQSLALNPAAESDEAENKRISDSWKAITADENRPLLNRPLQLQYVPGSTFKALTAIGALENPSILQQPKPIDCPDEYKPDPNAPPVVNAVRQGLGALIRQQTGRQIDLSGVFAFSCNTAFAQLGVRMGDDKLIELAKRFHIYLPKDAPERGEDFTDLPSAPSYLAVQNNFLNTELAVADTAFGQGQLQITPMQMALIGATIANEGVMPQPYIVESVTDPQNPDVFLYQHRAPRNILDSRRVISKDVADKMLPIMRDGVTIGFGKAANVGNSGGKSGTGETGVNNIIHAAFLAVAPVDNPRFVVYVQIENGRDGAGVGARSAGEVLQAAFDVFQQ